jgi:hypothetical protein
MVAALALTLLHPIVALSQATDDAGTRERARAKLLEGAKMMEGGNYAAALALFEEAHAIFPSQKIYYNMGLAYEKLGRNGPAFMAFERFLRQLPEDTPPQYVVHSREALERLAKRVAFVALTCDVADADVALDGHGVGRTPLPSRLAVDTGPHQIDVRRPDLGNKTHQFTALAGQSTELKIELRSAGAQAPSALSAPRLPPVVSSTAEGAPDPLLGAPAADDHPPRRAWLVPARWTAVGGAVAALTVGLVFNLKANSRRHEFETSPPSGSPPRACGIEGDKVVGGPRCQALADDYDGAKRNSVIAYAAGGALAVTAVVLFLINGDSGQDSAFLPGTTSSPLGVTYAARF